MAGKERNQVKRVLFIMIGATVLLVCATTTATSSPDESDKLVVPVYRLPMDMVARVNAASWAGKHSQ
jgi:hypothetical protein